MRRTRPCSGARALAASGTAGAAEIARARTAAFDAWFGALADGAPGSSVWWDLDEEGERRVSEGLEHAVLRRLEEASAAERGAWVERFGSAANLALGEVATDRAALAWIERAYPGTPAAATAALQACDLALESGRARDALAFVARGRRHARLADSQALRAAFDARERYATRAQSPALPAPSWTTATSLEYAGGLALRDQAQRPLTRVPDPSRGIRPGLAFLADGRVAVQTGRRVHVLRLAENGELERQSVFEPGELLQGMEPWVDARTVPNYAPGWPLLPVGDGDALVLVQGRTVPGGDSNALVCVRPPPDAPRPGPDLSRALVPELQWAVVGNQHLDGAGRVSEIEALSSLVDFEFQPGPLVSGERVIVQGREFDGEVRAWILAFDRASGRLLYRHLLASGADVTIDPGRLLGGTLGPRLAGQPLLALSAADGRAEERVFVGTHLGVGVLLDALDGRRCWSIKGRRRAPKDEGWDGGRPHLGPAVEDRPPCILWAGADSDRIYPLQAGPLRPGSAGASGPAGLFVAPPRALSESRVLLGGNAEEFVVHGMAGGERTIALRRPGADRIDALYVGPEEELRGTGLVSAERVVACSDRGLYLLDRSRELYLLDYAPLPSVGQGPAGGSLAARGASVLVCGLDAIWSYRAD